MRVVFMGTPEFAAASLKELIDEKFNIVGVFTQPDKAQNRGMKIVASPVKQLALEQGIEVYQPASLREGEGERLLKELKPDVLAVVAYGKILPVDMLDIAPLGAVNVHASLLPKYRGAAPIQWSVLNGDDITGVTTMFMAEGMDTGDMIYKEETAIGEYESAGDLSLRLADMGAKLLSRTLRDIEMGIAPRTAQEHENASYVKPLDKGLCPIDWSVDAKAVVKKVYGLSPWPVATAVIDGTEVKIHAVSMSETVTDKAAGTILRADDRGIEIACGQGVVCIKELQAAGKRRMSAGDYLRGRPIKI